MSDYNLANWYSDSGIPTPEAWNYFYTRTEKHIYLVRDNLYLWSEKKYPEYTSELHKRAIAHDLSKFREPEKTPFVWRTWQSYCTLNNLPFEYPEGMEQQVRDAIFHHITHNRHHPEYHPDPDEMNEIDLIEMVCDWKAMSQEFGEKSPMDWADNVLGRRFHFSTKKCNLIRDYIRELDIMVLQNEEAQRRLYEITPSNKELLDMVDQQNKGDE